MWHGRNVPEVRVARCDYAEHILKSSKHIEKSFTYKLLEPWLGDGMRTHLNLNLYHLNFFSSISGLISSTGIHSHREYFRIFVCFWMTLGSSVLRTTLVHPPASHHTDVSLFRVGEFLRSFLGKRELSRRRSRWCKYWWKTVQHLPNYNEICARYHLR